MRFHRYHGAGNDFVMLLDAEAAMGAAGTLDGGLVRALCDRHTGVGGDGLIRVLADDAVRAAGGVLHMDYYNGDGGAAEMCGNGIRCLGVLAYRAGLVGLGKHVVLTGAGPRPIVLEADESLPGGIAVAAHMGEPALQREQIPMRGSGSSLRVSIDLDGPFEATGVGMGNPHLVVFCDEIGRQLDDELVGGHGPRLERHPDFPARTNVEFVEVGSADEIRMRVWERGVGETMACGTGACAALVAAAALGRTKRHAVVAVPGGVLEVQWREDGVVWLRGPAEEICSGELSADWMTSRGLG